MRCESAFNATPSRGTRTVKAGCTCTWTRPRRVATYQDAAKIVLELTQEQVEYLRGQLEIWQEEARRKDHIIAALTERIPELEPARESPSEPRESPETPSAGAEGAE